MAWVRIHDLAMTHPKIVGLSDKCFRLWVWGLSYSQQHLTDGALPFAAIPARLKLAVDRLVSVRLWEPLPGLGWKVHDYLDWNDSREVVIAKREGAKTRLQSFREKRVSSLTSATALARGGVVLSSSSFPERESEGKPAVFGAGRISDTPDDDTGSRAAKFIDRYAELYPQYRHGARFFPKPALDYQTACDLVKIWPDDRLEKLAIIFLKTDHEFASSGSRTLRQFAALASWCDGRLAEVEKGRAQA